MITVVSSAMVGMKLQMSPGVDLYFDERGECRDVDEAIAMTLATMPGYKVIGLPPSKMKEVANRKAKLKAQIAAESTQLVRYAGYKNQEMVAVTPGTNTAMPYIGPGMSSRIPTDVQARLDRATAEREEAAKPKKKRKPLLKGKLKVKAGK